MKRKRHTRNMIFLLKNLYIWDWKDNVRHLNKLKFKTMNVNHSRDNRKRGERWDVFGESVTFSPHTVRIFYWKLCCSYSAYSFSGTARVVAVAPKIHLFHSISFLSRVYFCYIFLPKSGFLPSCSMCPRDLSSVYIDRISFFHVCQQQVSTHVS